MPRDKAKVEASLQAKGFSQRAGHHRYFVYVTLDGRITRASTKTSHAPKMKDIPDNLLGQMARQCFLARSEFLDLVDCPMDRVAFESVLRERGYL